jgi:hypothetical protein
MMAASVQTQGGFTLGNRTRLFEGPFDPGPTRITGYDVSRDGRTFVMLQQVQGSAQSVFVTLNWFESLGRPRR